MFKLSPPKTRLRIVSPSCRPLSVTPVSFPKRSRTCLDPLSTLTSCPLITLKKNFSSSTNSKFLSDRFNPAPGKLLPDKNRLQSRDQAHTSTLTTQFTLRSPKRFTNSNRKQSGRAWSGTKPLLLERLHLKINKKKSKSRLQDPVLTLQMTASP